MRTIKNFLKNELTFYVKRITKKYYIIRRSDLGAGFFSNYLWVLGHVVFAEKLGYIPVVDMENYLTLYSEKEIVDGTKNAWNYYFQNVGKISLEEAYKSRQYVLGNNKYLTQYSDRYCEGIYRFPTDMAIDFYTPYISKNMRIKENVLKKMDIDWKRLCEGRKKIAGVHVRGTDMKNNLGHPMPAPTEKYIGELKKIVNEDEDYQAIYLATDEMDIVRQFEKAFENTKVQVMYQSAFRSVNNMKEGKNVGIHEAIVKNPRRLHKYRLGLEVLEDAYILSKCNSLVCGHSNVTNVAVMWNNKMYERVLIVNE